MNRTPERTGLEPPVIAVATTGDLSLQSDRSAKAYRSGVRFTVSGVGSRDRVRARSPVRLRLRVTDLRGERIRSTGHGFAGIARREFLHILQERARAVGVDLRFETEVDPADLPPADLVLAADGANSRVREGLAPYLAYEAEPVPL